MRKVIILFSLIFAAGMLSAQELNCKVEITSPSLQTSAGDKQTFIQLQEQLTDFMNNTRWTTENFKQEEKIECNFLINLSEQTASDQFGGSIQITSRRPVYNSNYSTPLLNYKDNDFKFTYQRGTQLIFSIDQHRNNLTSVLAFYAYMIIAYDYDSFAPEGGSKYFVKAQQVVNNAQAASEPGWKAFEGDRNRYWMVDNALQSVFKPLRTAYYKYHRLGFDRLYENMEEGRKSVIEALELIQGVAKVRIASFNVQFFFSTKVNELVDLFKEAPDADKQKAYQLCKSMDPGNLTKYQKILNGGN